MGFQSIKKTKPSEEKLAVLNEAFKTTVPEQYHAQFASSFATVRVLIQAGEVGLAQAHINSLVLPPELEDARTQILALLTS